jgi:hypothetical protein
MVTLDQSVYKSLAIEIIRWNNTLNSLELEFDWS